MTIVPAQAVDELSPAPPIVHDAAGVTQDWFNVPAEPEYGYYWDELGTKPIAGGSRTYYDSGVPVTIYARHYTGSVRPFDMVFTNTPGIPAQNTVTILNPRCNPSTGFTEYEAYWNQVADGTGLESYGPKVEVFADRLAAPGASGFEFAVQPKDAYLTVPDGQSIRFDYVNSNSIVRAPGFIFYPGWHTLQVTEYSDRAFTGTVNGASSRLWVPACGSRTPPAGQVPPGGANPASASPSGRLKYLRKSNYVIAKGINREVSSRTVFRLKRPGVARPTRFVVPAGDVVSKRVEARKTGTYVLQALIQAGGRSAFLRVAKLVVRR